MKRLMALLGMALFLMIMSCKNTVPEDAIVVTGTVEKQTDSTNLYGTHTLSGEQSFFAISSEKINLDDYLNEKITVVGVEIIPNTTIKDGPIYLNILEVK